MEDNKIVVTVFFIILLFSTFFSYDVRGGEAGVGVLNVAPKFGTIRVVHQNSFMRIYLNLSDYNSWEDVYEVVVTLEDDGAEIARFLFKQYEDETKYEKINQFIELPEGGNLLVSEKCSYEHSDRGETVDERCNINIIFVFHTTWFSSLNIIVRDREGIESTTHIDYSTEEILRSENIIVLPGIKEPITIAIPSYLLNVLAMIAGFLGAMFCLKKRRTIKMRKSCYE
jgi:hypothetical protein